VFERASAVPAQLARGRDGASGGRPLCIGEVRGWSLAQLAVFHGREAEFGTALAPWIGAGVPVRPGMKSGQAQAQIYAIARGQYWIVASDSSWLAQLARAVPSGVGAATLLSHSRVRIAVEGAPAIRLLAKGIAIDLHPEVFSIGAFALTGLHHTGILLERSARDRYELYVQRTFAASIWGWLVDAALPFGYEVSVQHLKGNEA
jgi:heterotetrameric sarcosine oxidase gamma subunit